MNKKNYKKIGFIKKHSYGNQNVIVLFYLTINLLNENFHLPKTENR